MVFTYKAGTSRMATTALDPVALRCVRRLLQDARTPAAHLPAHKIPEPFLGELPLHMACYKSYGPQVVRLLVRVRTHVRHGRAGGRARCMVVQQRITTFSG